MWTCSELLFQLWDTIVNTLSCLLPASQPVEIMSYVTWKLSTFPATRVVGIGCNLDSQRLQYIITSVLKVQTSGKEVWVVGEQGENKGKCIIINYATNSKVVTFRCVLGLYT